VASVAFTAADVGDASLNPALVWCVRLAVVVAAPVLEVGRCTGGGGFLTVGPLAEQREQTLAPVPPPRAC